MINSKQIPRPVEKHPNKGDIQDFNWRAYIYARLNIWEKYTNNKNSIRIHSEKFLNICSDLNNLIDDIRMSPTKQIPMVEILKNKEIYRFILWGVYPKNFNKGVTFYPPEARQKNNFMYPCTGDVTSIKFKIYLDLYEIENEKGECKGVINNKITHSMYHNILRAAQKVYVYTPHNPGIDLHGKMVITKPFHVNDPDINTNYYTIQSIEFSNISNLKLQVLL